MLLPLWSTLSVTPIPSDKFDRLWVNSLYSNAEVVQAIHADDTDKAKELLEMDTSYGMIITNRDEKNPKSEDWEKSILKVFAKAGIEPETSSKTTNLLKILSYPLGSRRVSLPYGMPTGGSRENC